MDNVMRSILALALTSVLASSAVASMQTAPIERPMGAELRQPSSEGAATPIWRHPDPLPAQIEASLELGDSPDGATLSLLTTDRTSRYRVRVQYETSLALGDSGPHLDFHDWKHCLSSWHEASSEDGLNFVLPVPAEQEETCFPPVRAEEIVEQTRRVLVGYDLGAEADAHWLQIAREAQHAGGGQSYVAISTVRVRIEIRAPEGWRTLSILDFRLPMGC